MDASTPPLAKFLASPDKKTRDKALKSLSLFLSDASRDALSKVEMAKLWKGIFYCYWMSDKPLVQQALSSELAELLLTITSTSSSLDFLEGFWDAIIREWNGIDRLRMDKYYMLVRKFVNASFRLLIRAEWDTTACANYNSILVCKTTGPLCPDDTRVPTSLTYHLADVYFEELNKALASLSHPPLPAPLSTLISPFLHLAARTGSTITYQRIESAVIEPLFNGLVPPSDESPARKKARLIAPSYTAIIDNSCISLPREEKSVPPLDLRKVLLREMFNVASLPDTREANRRRMYNVWKNAIAEDDNTLNKEVDAS